jgi:hypothetical protein
MLAVRALLVSLLELYQRDVGTEDPEHSLP